MRRQELILFTVTLIIIVFILITVVIISVLPDSAAPRSSPLPSRGVSNNLPSFSPFIVPSPSPDYLPLPPEGATTSKEGLINLLPVQTVNFDIEYLSSDDLFVITIKNNPYQENLSKDEQWFEEWGLNIDDLNVYVFAFPQVDKPTQ